MPPFDPQGIRAITFDLYGTLLDLEATFGPAFAGFLHDRNSTLDAVELVRTWGVVLPARGHGRHFHWRTENILRATAADDTLADVLPRGN